MELGWSEYTRFTVALATIIDPIAAIPIYLSATEGFPLADRRRAARLAAFAVAGVLIAAALSGEALLKLMGTSLSAFRVGGGIVMLLMAISMLMARPADSDELALAGGGGDVGAVAVVPLGIPLLAGPGAISATVIQMQRGTGLLHATLVMLAIGLVAGSCWLVLRYAERIGQLLGTVGLAVVVRLFGLILTAIAVETIANGLKGLFPALAG